MFVEGRWRKTIVVGLVGGWWSVTCYMQHATYNMQPTTCNMLLATCNILAAICNMLPTTYNMQHATCNMLQYIQHAPFSHAHTHRPICSAMLMNRWENIESCMASKAVPDTSTVLPAGSTSMRTSPYSVIVATHPGSTSMVLGRECV